MATATNVVDNVHFSCESGIDVLMSQYILAQASVGGRAV